MLRGGAISSSNAFAEDGVSVRMRTSRASPGALAIRQWPNRAALDGMIAVLL